MQPALGSLVLVTFGVHQTLAQAGFTPLPYSFIQPANHSCVLQEKLPSCPNQDPTQVDSCCVETYGGLVLATQFWNTYTQPDQKLPANHWTLHGLWPDFCNGSYTGYCDVSRQFDPVPSPNVSAGGEQLQEYAGNVTGTNVLNMFKRLDLLEYMNKWAALLQESMSTF
ncbi:hypothetical protein P389DRAFT_194014 [Cystobasidium minutum MCA 4210]|uniref:uncharacterized protein n=1 Tax=Cystobasidium minutum MCA 4210 TaxID=1397322 RepID=UPI0034CDC7A5|eukprot:jgi/Rhomi1/194014/gm1.2228_g